MTTTKTTNTKSDHKKPTKPHEENMFNNVEHKVDKGINKIVKNKKVNKIVKKLVEAKVVKDILNSKVINDLNSKLEKNLPIIFKVLGWIAIVGGVLTLLGFLVALFGSVWTRAFGWRIRSIFYIIILLIIGVVTLFQGIGLIKNKKRLPFVALINFFVGIIAIIISFIPIGYIYGRAIRAGIGRGVLSLIVITVVLVLILKNKKKFNK